MPQKTVTSAVLDRSIARLRGDIEGMLGKTEERFMTAVFGFVNGAGARMSSLEAEDARLSQRIRDLETRIEAIEKHVGSA